MFRKNSIGYRGSEDIFPASYFMERGFGLTKNNFLINSYISVHPYSLFKKQHHVMFHSMSYNL